MRPRIGITCRYQIRSLAKGPDVPTVMLDARFCDRIIEAGGTPVLIPPTEDEAALREVLDGLDGVVLSGGPDCMPARYGETPHPRTATVEPRRDVTDFRVIEYAERRVLPTLAICLGIQELNVFRGGTLHQHLPEVAWEHPVAHRDDGDQFTYHPVRVASDSLLHRIVEKERLERVYSSHHQGLKTLGRGLRPTAWADDGLVEAVEDPARPFVLGIQWHPEDMPEDAFQRRLFAAVVAAART